MRTTDGPETPPLIDAAQKCDLAEVRKLLQHGADANTRDQSGSTPLHQAVQMSWPSDKINAGVEITKLLLEKGADPLLTDETGRTALEVFGTRNEQAIGVLRTHLEREIERAKLDPNNKPPLVTMRTVATAAREGDMGVLRLRLARGADPNGADANGRPLLHEAVLSDRRELVDLLLGAGARLDLLDPFTGDTPLHVAVSFEKYDTAKLLMAKGADPHRANATGQSSVWNEAQKRKPRLFDDEMYKAAKADVEEWGPAADGVQARLRRERLTWPLGQTPVVRVDVWNHWNRQLQVQTDPLALVVDGREYRQANRQTQVKELGPEVWVTDVIVRLDKSWNDEAGKPLELGVGTHWVRLRMSVPAKDGKKDLVVETSERVMEVRSQ